MISPDTKGICAVCWKLLPTLALWGGAVLSLMMIERISAPPFQWDRMFLAAAHGMRNLWLDRFFALITWAGSLYFLSPVTVFIAGCLARNGRNDDAWLLVLSLAGASLVAHLAKPLFQRGRPALFPPIGDLPLDASFPSAHTAQIVAFVFALYLVLRPAATGTGFWLAGTVLLVAAMVALSRIYLQVHYPSDVLGGMLLALLWVMGVENLLNVLGIRMR